MLEMIEGENVDPSFAYHTPGPTALRNMGIMRKLFSYTKRVLISMVEDPRLRAMIVTKLEELARLANEGIVKADPETKRTI